MRPAFVASVVVKREFVQRSPLGRRALNLAAEMAGELELFLRLRDGSTETHEV